MFRRLASMGVSGHRDGRRLPRRSCRYAGRQVPRPSHQPDLAGEGQERERQQVVRSGQRAGLRRCPSCRAPPCLSQTWCQLRRRSHRRRRPKPGRLRHRCRGRRRTRRLRRALAGHWGRNSMEEPGRFFIHACDNSYEGVCSFGPSGRKQLAQSISNVVAKVVDLKIRIGRCSDRLGDRANLPKCLRA